LERRYDAVVLAVPHRAYVDLGLDRITQLVADGGLFADLKNCFPQARYNSGVRLWTL